MELRDYFRAFTEDELVRGAELYYAGDISDISIHTDALLKKADCVEVKGSWTDSSYKTDDSKSSG